MVAQFSDVLDSFEKMLTQHIAEQNRTEFNKLSKENTELKAKSITLEAELKALKQRYDTLSSQQEKNKQELSVYKAKTQMQEAKVDSILKQLTLKTDENEKLTQLCDELITQLETYQSS